MRKPQTNMRAQGTIQEKDTTNTPRFNLGRRVVVPTVHTTEVRIGSTGNALSIGEIIKMITDDKKKVR